MGVFRQLTEKGMDKSQQSLSLVSRRLLALKKPRCRHLAKPLGVSREQIKVEI
jgi:hypothetical protein